MQVKNIDSRASSTCKGPKVDYASWAGGIAKSQLTGAEKEKERLVRDLVGCPGELGASR